MWEWRGCSPHPPLAKHNSINLMLLLLVLPGAKCAARYAASAHGLEATGPDGGAKHMPGCRFWCQARSPLDQPPCRPPNAFGTKCGCGTVIANSNGVRRCSCGRSVAVVANWQDPPLQQQQGLQALSLTPQQISAAPYKPPLAILLPGRLCIDVAGGGGGCRVAPYLRLLGNDGGCEALHAGLATSLGGDHNFGLNGVGYDVWRLPHRGDVHRCKAHIRHPTKGVHGLPGHRIARRGEVQNIATLIQLLLCWPACICLKECSPPCTTSAAVTRLQRAMLAQAFQQVQGFRSPSPFSDGLPCPPTNSPRKPSSCETKTR